MLIMDGIFNGDTLSVNYCMYACACVCFRDCISKGKGKR